MPIKYLDIIARCEKQKFFLSKDKAIDIFKEGDFVAMTTASFGKTIIVKNIIVTNSFFNKFSSSEQKGIIWHELHHKKFWTFFIRQINTIRFLSRREARWREEFAADKYAAENVGRNVVINTLKKLGKTYSSGAETRDENTHPSIEERINRIKNQGQV